MEKIKMPVPIAELDGDEMTHVLWGMIKDTLIKPFVDLNTEYYDLSLPHREETADAVTAQAAEAIKRLKIGVKCATITPNLQRQEEYGLSQLWKSPNATIRAALDGTVFRAPILLKRVKPVVTCWEKPVTIARHAYGDLYKAVEYRVPGAGKAELVFTDESGRELSRQTVFDFKGPGVVQAMHNRDASILSFARCCFTYALSVGQDVWFGAKDTISKDYDQTFKLLFQQVYDEEYKAAFEQAGLHYRYALIDDIAAKVLRSKGGIVWACKNYDGDVMSDLVAAASGSLPMMTSVLVSPDGRPRHRHRSLLPLAEGRKGIHQPPGHHVRLGRRPAEAGRTGRQRRPGALFRLPGAGGAGYIRGRALYRGPDHAVRPVGIHRQAGQRHAAGSDPCAAGSAADSVT